MRESEMQGIKESLSALADDEAAVNQNMTEGELFVLAGRDKDLMASWECMHITRDVMQADYCPAIQPGFAAGISDIIAGEPELQHDEISTDRVVSLSSARQRRSNSSARPARSSQQQPFVLWKPVAGLGLAASLAGATFLFAQLWQNEQTDSGLSGSQVASVSTSTDDAVQTVVSQDSNASEDSGVQTLQASVQQAPESNGGTRWHMDSELPRNQQIEQRLNALLTNHLEDASMGRVTGMMSHSRVVGYDSMPSEESSNSDQ